MASTTFTLRASAACRPCCKVGAVRAPSRCLPVATVPRTWQNTAPALPGRSSLKRLSSDTGAENDDKLVGEHGEILQGRQEKPTMTGAGMEGEDKRAQKPEQGGAPEGDRAVAGQETQLTGEPSGAQPDSGDKMADQSDKPAGQVASEEASEQEDRAPLQD